MKEAQGSVVRLYWCGLVWSGVECIGVRGKPTSNLHKRTRNSDAVPNHN